jgi:MFS family permease
MTAPARRHTPPALFAVLELPFSAAVGMLQVAIPFWLAGQGLSIAQIGVVSAVGFTPHAWKALWMPLLDAGPRRRTWYRLAALIVAAFSVAIVLLPDPAHHLATFQWLVVGAQVGAATTGGAVDALMALTTAPADKGRAAGWKMAGNVGGIGLIGALLLWLRSHASPAVQAVVVAAFALGPTLALAALGDEPIIASASAAAGLKAAWARARGIAVDLWATVRSRAGWTGLVLCAAPVGAGALVNLLSGIAPAYQASEAVVALVDGLAGGLVAAAGAVLGGMIIDRMNRRVAYCLFAGLTALCAIGLALGPPQPSTFMAGTLGYRFFNGITMAAFAGMILELVGEGRAVATTYTLYVAVSNQAISVVTWLDGAGSRVGGLGAAGTALTDAALTFLGIGIVALVLRLSAPPAPGARRAAPSGATPP